MSSAQSRPFAIPLSYVAVLPDATAASPALEEFWRDAEAALRVSPEVAREFIGDLCARQALLEHEGRPLTQATANSITLRERNLFSQCVAKGYCD